MIYGRLIDSKAIVPVIFRLPTQPNFSINFIIDTGFQRPSYLTTTSRQRDESAVIFHYAC